MICSSVNRAFICPSFCCANSTQIWKSFRDSGQPVTSLVWVSAIGFTEVDACYNSIVTTTRSGGAEGAVQPFSWVTEGTTALDHLRPSPEGLGQEKAG